MKSKLQVIIASTRPGRAGPTIAKWFLQYAADYAAFDVSLVDVDHFNFPVYDEPLHPRTHQYKHEHMKRWGASVVEANAYVFVTPEYNFGPPPSLVNAINFVYVKWNYKPAGIACPPDCGLRTAQALKPILTAVKVMPVPEGVGIRHFVQFINAEETFTPNELIVASSKAMPDKLVRWTEPLGRHPKIPMSSWLPLLSGPPGRQRTPKQDILQRKCMNYSNKSGWVGTFLTTALVLLSPAALAQKKYDPGASDTYIKVGNIMPYSGPVSAYSTMGKAEAAYFDKVNAEGGINGRKITFISYDDAYSPPKAVEQVRKLVESDEVLLVFHPLGTPSNTAIHKYLNQKKVPHLLVGSGASKWGDIKNYPWTINSQPTYRGEGRVYAKYILEKRPAGKIAVLYQNDDYGKDYLRGLKDGLEGKAASMIVAEESYETTEPTIDSHIVKLKATHADVFVNIATQKFAAQAIRKAAEIGWKPLHIVNNVASSVGAVLKPAGLENSQGLVSTAYAKDPTDPQWQGDPAMGAFMSFLDKYYPGADKSDVNNLHGYNYARMLVKVLEQCGDDLTRENVMRQALNLHDFEPGGLLPGIKVSSSEGSPYPVNQLRMIVFEGDRWKLFGDIETADK